VKPLAAGNYAERKPAKHLFKKPKSIDIDIVRRSA
jgi:hypothetical protein